MLLVARLSWVFALLAFPIGGCTQVTAPSGAPVEVTITGWPGLRVPLEGVELCETGTSNCQTTNANGEAKLWLPVGETSFTKTKDDYGSYLVPLVVPVEGLRHASRMGTEEVLETLHEDVMSPYPMGDVGRVSIDVLPGVEGATFDLFDATAGKLTVKTYYSDEGPTWRLDLTATTTTGGGGFLEISPGEYQAQFGGTVDECTPGPTGWPGLFLPNSVRFPVREGHITQFGASCSSR